jgi:hypothetical protein
LEEVVVLLRKAFFSGVFPKTTKISRKLGEKEKRR